MKYDYTKKIIRVKNNPREEGLITTFSFIFAVFSIFIKQALTGPTTLTFSLSLLYIVAVSMMYFLLKDVFSKMWELMKFNKKYKREIPKGIK